VLLNELVALVEISWTLDLARVAARRTLLGKRFVTLFAPLGVFVPEALVTVGVLATPETAGELDSLGLASFGFSAYGIVHTDGMVLFGRLHLGRIRQQNSTNVSDHVTAVVVATHFVLANMTGCVKAARHF
jgi:ABC-type sulfate transport system permease component